MVHLVNQTNEIDQTNQTTVFSNSFLDFAATKATCADPNAFGLAIDQCSDWLEVGLEDPLGLVIGMTDIVAGLATFATEITCKCHGYTPSSSRIDTRLCSSKCTTGPSALTSRFDGASVAWERQVS